MGIETERKFLVANDSWRAAAEAGIAFKQGYLCADGPASVRVRIEGERANINIKQAVVGVSRAEYEYAVPLTEAREMLATLCVAPPVEKTRYRVPVPGHVWEVDEFAGANAGLVVAEIELDCADEAFAKPAWLGREVSNERRYYNHALALHPYRTWHEPGEA